MRPGIPAIVPIVHTLLQALLSCPLQLPALAMTGVVPILSIIPTGSKPYVLREEWRTPSAGWPSPDPSNRVCDYRSAPRRQGSCSGRLPQYPLLTSKLLRERREIFFSMAQKCLKRPAKFSSTHLYALFHTRHPQNITLTIIPPVVGFVPRPLVSMSISSRQPLSRNRLLCMCG